MITINELQVENLKRIKAVKLEPSASGLTVIGEKNVWLGPHGRMERYVPATGTAPSAGERQEGREND